MPVISTMPEDDYDAEDGWRFGEWDLDDANDPSSHADYVCGVPVEDDLEDWDE